MKTIRILAIILAASLLFTACKKSDEDNCIQGNGDLIQQTRDIDDFKKIYASGAFNISFSQINNTRVDLFGDSNILPIITTTVNSGVLNVGIENNQCYDTQNIIEVTATSQSFEGVTLDGAGEIEALNIISDQLHFETNGDATISSSFTTEFVTVYMSGSGNALLTGNSDHGGFEIRGAGSIQASTLIIDICTITIEGSGDIYIHVNNEMTVVISGTGNVYYTGDPDINSLITGTGQVIKVD